MLCAVTVAGAGETSVDETDVNLLSQLAVGRERQRYLSEADRELLAGDNCSQDKAGEWARSFGGRCSGEGFMLIKWSGTPHGGGDI